MVPGGCEVWYGDAPYYVKLIGPPGTLASDILRLKSDLPRCNCDLEIIGNDVRDTIKKAMIEDDDIDPDVEDCSEEVAQLPLIAFDADQHFSKNPTYKKEIRYLLQSRGSPHVVQLLGRTKDGALVFPKFEHDSVTNIMSHKNEGRVQNIRRWMLEVIDGVAYLHSLGICHNATPHCRPVEIDDGDYSKFSFANDVFALGTLLWTYCFYNNPLNREVLLDTPPPPPFRDIFIACTQERVGDRPAITQLRAMYDTIRLPNH
ncbi:hypothetical protein B0H34DRAFT_792120 [Crassisporium funariophilum]|nr:hypothetical protein B0H34DRAFT_792120 [Crassisporium funariophilum]